MTFTIGEVAEKMNLSVYTIRYYDKEGLFPFLNRGTRGLRLFRQQDIEWIRLIGCLKSSGMPIKDIKKFLEWTQKGDATLKERRDMVHQRKEIFLEQIEEMQKMLEIIDFKCWYYDTAFEAGTEKIHENLHKEIQKPKINVRNKSKI